MYVCMHAYMLPFKCWANLEELLLFLMARLCSLHFLRNICLSDLHNSNNAQQYAAFTYNVQYAVRYG